MRSTRFLIYAAVAALAGCSRGPTVDELQNRKALDAVLTAVTLQNVEQLDEDACLLDARRAEGRVSQAHHEALTALIAQARSGDWLSAEEKLYKFRKAHPFVR